MDKISDKIDLALKVVSTCCCVTGLALTYKNLKDLKHLKDDNRLHDDLIECILKQIDNDTDIHKESDQTNN